MVLASLSFNHGRHYNLSYELFAFEQVLPLHTPSVLFNREYACIELGFALVTHLLSNGESTYELQKLFIRSTEEARPK